jgi:hypothetical protein
MCCCPYFSISLLRYASFQLDLLASFDFALTLVRFHIRFRYMELARVSDLNAVNSSDFANYQFLVQRDRSLLNLSLEHVALSGIWVHPYIW